MFILHKIINNTKHLCITARKVSTKIDFKFFFVEIKIILITFMFWGINSSVVVEDLLSSQCGRIVFDFRKETFELVFDSSFD